MNSDYLVGGGKTLRGLFPETRFIAVEKVLDHLDRYARESITDRHGNNRLDSQSNTVENQQVDLLFKIPGIDDRGGTVSLRHLTGRDCR